MSSSKPNYFPKVSPPNIIILGVRALTQGFGGDTDIQYVTNMIEKLQFIFEQVGLEGFFFFTALKWRCPLVGWICEWVLEKQGITNETNLKPPHEDK